MRNKKSTAQKMKFSIIDFFGKRDQIRNFLRIWSYLLRKFLMENFTFCAVKFGKNKIMTTKKPSYLLMNNVDEIQFCINSIIILFYSFCFINSNNSCCVIMPAFVIGATILFGKVK